MSNFSYFKITKSKKIRYLKISKKKATYVVFLHGFMSDLEGKKPRSFLNFSKKLYHQVVYFYDQFRHQIN